MKGFYDDIEKSSIENENFRKVLYTAKNTQLVLMSLKPGEDIGVEVHEEDQFFRVEQGTGLALVDEQKYEVKDGDVVVVPAGSTHNITNTGSESLKLYTLYSPPHHKDGTVHITREEAMADEEEHFDGVTTE